MLNGRRAVWKSQLQLWWLRPVKSGPLWLVSRAGWNMSKENGQASLLPCWCPACSRRHSADCSHADLTVLPSCFTGVSKSIWLKIQGCFLRMEKSKTHKEGFVKQHWRLKENLELFLLWLSGSEPWSRAAHRPRRCLAMGATGILLPRFSQTGRVRETTQLTWWSVQQKWMQELPSCYEPGWDPSTFHRGSWVAATWTFSCSPHRLLTWNK